MSPRVENELRPPGNNIATVPVAVISPTSSMDPIIAEESGCDDSGNIVTRLSPRRWLVLFAMTCFGFAMTVAGDTAPILNLILKLLDLPLDRYVYINQALFYIMAIMAIPIAWMVDKYGIKVAIYTAVGLFTMNCSIRALLYSPDLPNWSDFKLYYYVVSCIFGSAVLGIVILMPLKISETWFSESERSVAWTIMESQLDLGRCIASFLYPRLMQDIKDIQLLAYINLVSMFVVAIVCLSCVTQKAPEHPPSKRMAESSKDTTPFIISVKKMLKDKNIILHLVHSSVGISLGITIGNLLQNILTSSGHSEIFSGNFMSINALVAIIMLVFMSRFVHRMSDIVLTCKVFSLLSGILFVAYITTLIYSAPGWVIICVSIVSTICRSMASPNFTNMTAHLASGVVSQATIIAFSMTMMVGIITVFQIAFISLATKIDDKTYDYSHSLIFFGIVCFINESIYITFFQGKSESKLSDDADRDRESSVH